MAAVIPKPCVLTWATPATFLITVTYCMLLTSSSSEVITKILNACTYFYISHKNTLNISMQCELRVWLFVTSIQITVNIFKFRFFILSPCMLLHSLFLPTHALIN